MDKSQLFHKVMLQLSEFWGKVLQPPLVMGDIVIVIESYNKKNKT